VSSALHQSKRMAQETRNDEHLAELMRAAQRGDGRAYARLLEQLVPRLRHIVRAQRKLLQAPDIEDLVQDVLLSLHAVRATYDPRRPFMPWLLAIVRHRLADAARRHARRAGDETEVGESLVTFSPHQPNMEPGTPHDPEALRRAIQDLPPGQREAIEMVKLRELSLKGAAAVSGMSIGALKVAVHRAIGTLRKALVKN
jgi:RNA polymerase sigma factor (sigma-70 family)